MDVVAPGVEGQVLPCGQAVVDAEEVGHVADVVAGGVRVTRHLDTVDHGAPRGGFQQGGKDAEGRRLAGTVGADEAEDLAVGHLEAEAGQGIEVGIALGEVLDKDGRGGAVPVTHAEGARSPLTSMVPSSAELLVVWARTRSNPSGDTWSPGAVTSVACETDRGRGSHVEVRKL